MFWLAPIAFNTRLLCVSITPLGAPVVPDVYKIAVSALLSMAKFFIGVLLLPIRSDRLFIAM
jgi:hypothetical protein